MPYGLFYKHAEITKKNGRLPIAEDAVKPAKERFWEGDVYEFAKWTYPGKDEEEGDYFDTGFLSPRINFALFMAAWLIGILGVCAGLR